MQFRVEMTIFETKLEFRIKKSNFGDQSAIFGLNWHFYDKFAILSQIGDL